MRERTDLWLALTKAEVRYLGKFYCTSNKKYNSIKLPLYVEQHNSPRIQYKQSLLLDQNKILKKNQMKMVIVSDSYLTDGNWPDASSLTPRVFACCPCVVCNVYLDGKRNWRFGRAYVTWSP